MVSLSREMCADAYIGPASGDRDSSGWIRLCLALMASSAVWVAVGSAFAQQQSVTSGLERAEQHLEQAQFSEALQVLEDLEAQEELSRAHLARMLETKAVARFALGQLGAMRRELRRLAVYAPSHQLPSTVAPAIREAFEEARRASPAPALEVQAAPVAGGLSIEATLAGPTKDLVSRVVIYSRFAQESWVASPGMRLKIPAPAGASVEYYAAAQGPGDVVIVQRGSAEDPLQATMPGSAGAASFDRAAWTARDKQDQATSASPWPWITAGAVAAVAGGVIAALLISQNQDDKARYSAPRFDWAAVSLR